MRALAPRDDRRGDAGGASTFCDPFEVEQDIVGGLKARVRILCQAHADQKVEGRWRERLELADRRRIVFQDGAEQARLAPAVKGFATGDDFVEQRPEGKDICSRVGVAAFELLGGHVLERAENSPACRERRVAVAVAVISPPDTLVAAPSFARPKSSSLAVGRLRSCFPARETHCRASGRDG